MIISMTALSCEKYDRPVKDLDQLEQEVAGLIKVRTQKLPFKAPIAWALVQNGQVKSAYHQGFEIPGENTPVSGQSLFLLASASKMITSVMVMKAVEEGKIQLNTKLSEYLNNLPLSWQNINLSQLLSHTDGIADVMDNVKYKALDPTVAMDLSRQKYLEYAAELPLRFEAGKQTQYGQSGFVLLSLMLEHIYQMPYETLIAQKIFIPLGMQQTHFFKEGDKIGDYKPQVFEPSGNSFKKVTPPYVYADFATAGVCINMKDMIRFISALQKHELLNADSFKRLYTPIADRPAFALGWQFRYKNGQLMVGHTGGWSVVVMHFPATNATSIFLSAAADESILNTGYQVAEKALEYTKQ